MPLFQSVDFEAIARVLGAGAGAGQVFKADGADSGVMTLNTQTISNHITVGKSGDVEFNTIGAANTAAQVRGVSSTNPFGIKVYPGFYVENPMTVIPGTYIRSSDTRADDTVIQAANAAEDLFTVMGGNVFGFRLEGVTDPAKCLLRCATPYSLNTFLGISFRHCSNGLILSNGAAAIIVTGAAIVGGPGEESGTILKATGAGSFLGIAGLFAQVPSVLLPYYAVNPIQRLIEVSDSADSYIATLSASIAYKDTSQETLYCDNGGKLFMFGGQLSNSANALVVGSSGANSSMTVLGASLVNNVKDVVIQSSTGKVFANILTDTLATDIVAGAQLVGMVQSSDDNRLRFIGDTFYQNLATGKELDIGLAFAKYLATGVITGGAVTAATGLYVDVAAGEALVRRGTPNDDISSVSWAAVEDLLLTANTTNYVVYNSVAAEIQATTSPPGYGEQVLLTTAVTDSSSIRFLHKTRNFVTGPMEQLRTYLLSTRKLALNSGLGVVEGTVDTRFDTGLGSYYVALDLMSYAGSADTVFSYFYGTNGATEVASQTDLDETNFDSAGTLTAMTTDYYKVDTVILTSDGRVSVIYGVAEYDSEANAAAAPSGNTPTFMEATSFPLAKIVVKQGAGIQSIIDIRPQPAIGTGGGGGGGVTVHGAMSGLEADDHTQYLLVSGARAMSGGLNMGTNNISNAGTINSVSITAHGARHQPGGADAIALGTPTGVLVAATAAEGTAASLARSDHQHGIATGTPSSIGAANAAGSSSSTVRLDHVHAHGDQAGGSTHEVATISVAGFESAADKTKLDGIEANATATPLAVVAPVNVTKAAASAGVGTSASRQDHKHDVTTATTATGAVQIGNSATEGTATSLARSDHQHAVTAGTPVSVSTANATGDAVTFARSNHVHAGLTRGAGDIDTFAVKAFLGINDLFIIEDGDAANAKKKITSSMLISLFTPIFGANPHYTESEAESNTTDTAYQTKVTLNTVTLPAGTYHIGWYSEIRNASGSVDTLVRVQVDGTNTLCETNVEPKDVSNYYPNSGFRQVTFATATTHQILLAYRSEGAIVSYIRRARVQLYRIY